MNKERLKLFLAGCGCSVLVVLFLAGLFWWIPAARLTTFSGSQNGANPQQPFGSSNANRPLAIPSLVQTHVATAPVGTTPLVNAQAGTAIPNSVSSAYLNQLYETVSPGVVSIYVTLNTQGQTGEAAGSGFIFDEAGDVVTNNHVVENANLVLVVFQDGSESLAKIVGTDPYSDLAVVKVERLPDAARALPLGDSDSVLTGDWVAAIGNPFGLESSMSIGIVSAVGRTIPSNTASFSIPMAIQTDAAINPGNSGGPLLNLQGQVIGVNAQIASGNSGANAGVGFSIPSNIVRRVIPSLIKTGHFQWPWLGIEGTSMNLFIAQANHLSVEKGAYIVRVISGGPAEQAGLKGGTNTAKVDGLDVPTGGDVIVAADGQPINNYTDLLALTAQREPGTDLKLTILRNGQQQTITITLGPRPTS